MTETVRKFEILMEVEYFGDAVDIFKEICDKFESHLSVKRIRFIAEIEKKEE